MALSWTLDKIGPMARSIADANMVFGAIVGEDERDPATHQVFPSGRASWVASSVMAREANRRKARIGLVKGTWDKVQPAVRENFLASVDVLRGQGHTIEEIDYPELPYGPAISVIVDAEGASAFEDILADGRAKQLRSVDDRRGGFAGAATLAIDYLRAQRIRPKIRRALLDVFAKVDLVAAPTRSTVAYPVGPNFDEVYKDVRSGPPVIPSMNLLGAPGVALPNGFGENGLPTSIQLNAAPANEMLAVNVGMQLQSATEFHSKRPKGFG